MAYFSRPTFLHPENRIPTDEINKDVNEHQPNHPRPELVARFARTTTVEQRYFSDPLDVTASRATWEERNNAAVANINERAERALRMKLDEYGIHPTELDFIIVCHATGTQIPGAAVNLAHKLRAPQVMPIDITESACAATAHAFIMAARLLASMPGGMGAVIVSEDLSSTYHRSDSDKFSTMGKYFFADGTGVVIATNDDRQRFSPGLHIAANDGFHRVIPGTAISYASHFRQDGMHFYSSGVEGVDPPRGTRTDIPHATEAADLVMPDLWEWIEKTSPGWSPAWVLAHPGGPQILDRIRDGLKVPESYMRHSRDTLRDFGNAGGPILTRVYASMFNDPPATGAEGLGIAVGPGVVVPAFRARWVN